MENNQQNKETEKVYTAGEVGSLLESINDGIKVIAEDQSSMKKDIKEIKANIDSITSDVVDIKTELKVINTKLNGKVEKETVENHEQRIVKLEKVAAIA
jgi:hypothetical protein